MSKVSNIWWDCSFHSVAIYAVKQQRLYDYISLVRGKEAEREVSMITDIAMCIVIPVSKARLLQDSNHSIILPFTGAPLKNNISCT